MSLTIDAAKFKAAELKYREYNMTVQVVNRSGAVIREPRVFAYMFTNIGDTIARVNGMVIFPSTTPATALGDARVVSGHVMDLFKGNINVVFDSPGGATPLVEIVQLYYID